METKHTYHFGPFLLDPAERRLLCDGQPVPVTPKCFDLLTVLVENNGHLLDKEELLQRLWPDQFVEESNLSFNISTLRKALSEGQDGQRYIETVPKKGFRFIAPVMVLDDSGSNPFAEGASSKGSSTAGSKLESPQKSSGGYWLSRRSLRLVAVTAIVVVVIGLTWLAWAKKRSLTSVGSPIKTLAVLPFKPLSADSRDESLEMGMAETLITRLSKVRQIVVRPMNAVRKYSDPQVDAIKAGHELQAEAVLDGSIQKAGDRVRVTVRLMNVQSGATLWAEQFDENFTEIFAVQDSISARVTNSLLLKLSGDEEKQVAKRYTNDPEAYQLFLHGEYLLYKYDPKSLDFYQQAAAKDPQFGLAYIGIAESYLHHIGIYKISAEIGVPKARAALAQALKLDDTLAAAYNAQAEIKYQLEYDWSGAEEDFRTAIKLDPNAVQIQLAYGWFLMTAGRFDEAWSRLRKAQEHDPHNRLVNGAIGQLFYFSRQYDKAIGHYQNLLVLEPDDAWFLASLAKAHEQKGMYAEAVAEQLRHANSTESLKEKQIQKSREAFRASGWQGYLQIQRAQMEERAKRETVKHTEMATLYARLGNKDRAFASLKNAVDEHDPWICQLRIEPQYDSLRSDPRYLKLLQRMNMTP